MIWPFRPSLPKKRDISQADWEAFKAIYGGQGWKTFERIVENRRDQHLKDILADWYKAPATEDGVMAAGLHTMSLVSRIREAEDILEEIENELGMEPEPIPMASPKTIDQYLP